MLNKVLLNWCIPKNYLAHSKRSDNKVYKQTIWIRLEFYYFFSAV